jgi:alginate O-acetyltransferase complex protein AlgI
MLTFGVVLAVLLLWLAAWHLPSYKHRQALLLLASYLFYGSWGLGFLLVLIASSIMNFVWGFILKRRVSAILLWIGVALNLLLLIFFKYLPPLLEAGAATSWHSGLFRQISMPLGISFWTLQGLSYLFDIYREEELDPSLLEVCLYMAFWPTVLSGPVCRLPNMLPQFREVRGFKTDDLSVGVRRLMQGLVMKFVLAHLLASGLTQGEGVDAGFDYVKNGWYAVDVWLLAIGFGFQLFFDFAGYSHIVIGISRLFGIRLEENFNRPYLSLTPSIFWTRWHMSLSFWIRDYVFLPLAALRRGRWWLYLSLLSAMVLFGLWHAAEATLILWGVYHGLLLVMHRVGQQVKRTLPFTWPPGLGALLSWAATFCAVCLGWILFRAANLDEALLMLGSVFSFSRYGQLSLPSNYYVVTLSVIMGYFGFEGAKSLLAFWRARYREAPSLPRLGIATIQFFDLLEERVWWWLTPMSLVALALTGIVIFDKNATVTPFVYTLF